MYLSPGSSFPEDGSEDGSEESSGECGFSTLRLVRSVCRGELLLGVSPRLSMCVCPGELLLGVSPFKLHIHDYNKGTKVVRRHYIKDKGGIDAVVSLKNRCVSLYEPGTLYNRTPHLSGHFPLMYIY